MGALILKKLKHLKIGDYTIYGARFSTDPAIPQPKGKTYTGAELMVPREVPFGIVPIGTDTRTPGFTGKRKGGSVRGLRPRGVGRR